MQEREERPIGINQIVWDPVTHTLHAIADELLDQHTRYTLLVTRGVRDPSGAAIEASEMFRRFRQTVREPYRQALLEAIQASRRVGVREDDSAAVSVFTTQSFSHVMERIRDAVRPPRRRPSTSPSVPAGRVPCSASRRWKTSRSTPRPARPAPSHRGRSPISS